MNPAQLAKSYRTMAITTATPGQIILMLYDGALRSMAIALNGFEETCPRDEVIHTKIANAIDIIRELQRSLNMRVPGDFPRRMFALYDYMANQLLQAEIRKDPEPIRVVERLLGKIRDSWAQMLDSSAARAA